MLQGRQRLLEAHYRLAVGRARLGFVPGLAAIGQGLLPHLAPQGMLRQPFHLVVQSVPCQDLQRLNNMRVQHAPPLVQQTLIGHLMGEGVLEGVGALRKQARLIEKLRRLELGETAVERLVGRIGNGL